MEINSSSSFIEGIQSTSLDALRMKIAAAAKKYHDDPFVFEMEKKKSYKTFLPIINRGTWSRVYTIYSNISKILENIQENNPDIKVNIISLGAGYDTLYFKLKQNYNNFQYIEFDYSNITYKKIELIKKSTTLKELLNLDGDSKVEKGNLLSKDYFLFECDITDNSAIDAKLCEIPNFDFTVPTIVLAECLLVYLKKETSYSILKNFTTIFKNIILLEYDLIGANDEFGKEMIHNLLEKRDIKLYGYEDVPDVHSQIERLKKTGFNQVEAYNMLEYYTNFLDINEKKRIEALEFVDEFEEWNLLQSHSCFGYGLKVEEKYSYLADIIKINK